jgi:SAM-dependent methyltransferase
MITRTHNIIEHLKGPVILDIGCVGQGLSPNSPNWLHGLIISRYPETYGIDIDYKSIEELKNKGYINIKVASAETFKIDRKFDTIVAGEIIEHLANPGLFLKSAKYHLKKDGRVIITTPYPFSLINFLYAFYKYPKTSSNAEHACWFCPSNLYSIAERFNFKVVHLELLADYNPNSSSIVNRIFVSFIRYFGWLIPKRLRNNTIFIILEPITDK